MCRRLRAPPRGGSRGKQTLSRQCSGSASKLAETIQCPISKAPGTQIGRAVTAALIRRISPRGAITSRLHSFRSRTHFIARYPITTSRTANSNPKRRLLFPGLSRRIQRRGSLSAKVAGLLSARVIAPAMRSGRIAVHFEPTTFNMFSRTRNQSQTLTTPRASMCLPPCATIWDSNPPMSPTGSLSKFAMCRRAPGEATERTTISFWQSGSSNSEWFRRPRNPPKSSCRS